MGKGPGTVTRAVRLGRAGAGTRTANSVQRVSASAAARGRTFNADREINLANRRRASR